MTKPLPLSGEPTAAARLAVTAKLNRLEELREFAGAEGRKAGLPSDRLAALDLVVEEAVVNVISYAYPDGPGTVEIVCRTEGEAFVVAIVDTGIPFDPTAAPSPDTTLPLEERTIGGLGLLLIRRSCDGISWQREGGRNILSCRFSHEPGSIRAVGRQP